MHNAGAEIVGGTKTFSSSPVVPVPTLGGHAATKLYVDSTVSAGAPDASTTAKGIVQLSGDLSGTATAPTVPGLAGKQAASADLTAIAALAPADDDMLQRKAGAWTNRTPTQLKLDLNLTKSDVGLGNADNTSDNDKPTSAATQAVLGAKAPLASPTFTGTVTVPTPTNGTDATTKAYVDAQVASGAAPDATTTSKGIVQLAGDLSGTAAAPTVPGLTGKADDTTVVHKAGIEIITGSKNFTGGLTVNGNAVVDTTDPRMTDARDLKPPTADVNFNGHKAINLANPTAPQDAATKNYVDNYFDWDQMLKSQVFG